jgi:subtilisin family serine protease
MQKRLIRNALAMGLSAVVGVAVALPAQAATTAPGVQPNPPAWGLDRVDQRSGVDQSYHYETNADQVTAYVIDSGIDARHPEFEGRVEPGVNLADGNNDTSDINGHGTHVAGIIGSKTYGIAKDVQLVPVRVLDKEGGGTPESIIAGIQWVTQNARQPAVAFLGIGGIPNDKLDAAVRALAAVVPVAVAAGGESADASEFSPARVTEALTVGASDILDRTALTSNYGSVVDLYAPGVEVPSPAPDGPGAGVLSGTSIAAAHVTGAAALYRALHPGATAPEVAKALVDNATKDVLTGVPEGTPNRLLYTLSVR